MIPPFIVALVTFIGTVLFQKWVEANKDQFSDPDTAFLELIADTLPKIGGFFLLMVIIVPVLVSIKQVAHAIGLVFKYRKLSLFYPAVIFGCYALINSMWENHIFAWMFAAYFLAAVYPLPFNNVFSRIFYISLVAFASSGVFTLWINTGTHQSISPSNVSLMVAYSSLLIRASGVVLVYLITLKLSPLPHENLIFIKDSVVKFVETALSDRKLWPLYPVVAYGSYAILNAACSRIDIPWILAIVWINNDCPVPDNITSRSIFYGSEILFVSIASFFLFFDIKLEHPHIILQPDGASLGCIFLVITIFSILGYNMAYILDVKGARQSPESRKGECSQHA